jgi:hypothetical protein
MVFFFRSAINAPATGDCSFAAWLAASKALGTNAINVGRSLVPQASQASVYLLYLGRFSANLHWPCFGWCGRSGDSCAFVSHQLNPVRSRPHPQAAALPKPFFLNSFGAAFGKSEAGVCRFNKWKKPGTTAVWRKAVIPFRVIILRGLGSDSFMCSMLLYVTRTRTSHSDVSMSTTLLIVYRLGPRTKYNFIFLTEKKIV